jgi:uncharacterized protein YbjT (DUF2867 family)
VSILENPGPHIGQAYQLNGPVEYSHAELAKVVGQALGKPVVLEQVKVIEFLKLIGLENDSAKKNHIAAARIDQQEGLLGMAHAARMGRIARRVRTSLRRTANRRTT